MCEKWIVEIVHGMCIDIYFLLVADIYRLPYTERKYKTHEEFYIAY